jgi:hypothetical protein
MNKLGDVGVWIPLTYLNSNALGHASQRLSLDGEM